MTHFRTVVRRLLASSLALLAAGLSAQPIPTYTVVTQTHAKGFTLEGVVQPVHQASVAAQTQGRILSLRVKAGDRVKAGQLLGTIDDREAAIGSERSQAQMAQAQAEFRNAQLQWERARDLQQKGFVSKAALDTASSQMQAAQAAKDQAAATIKLSGVAQAYARVLAPFDGWVLQTHAQAGDLAVPGTPIVTVYAPQPMRAVVQVPQSRAEEAKAATGVMVESGQGSAGGQRMTPIARQIVPSADPVSQTTEWRLDLAPQDTAALLPGEPVRVVFMGTQAKPAVAMQVPIQAIVRRGELTAVYVAQGSRFALRPVRTGALRTGGYQEILAGLRVGEVVALDPIKAADAR